MDHCSLWPEGVWAHCCEIHDHSALDTASAIALGRCVAATGHPIMGVVMAVGVILFGGIYVAIKRRWRR